MTGLVVVLLTKHASALKVYMTHEEGKTCVEIKSKKDWEAFPENIIVKNFPDLLQNLIKSTDYITYRAALYKIKQTSSDLYHTAQPKEQELFNNAFRFLHEHATIHPDHHCKVTLEMPGVSGSTGPYKAHTDTLNELIHFIDEYALGHYVNKERKYFIHGYMYQQTPWYELTNWLPTYFEEKNDDFELGRYECKHRLK